jgi:hypothetical protein
MAGAIPARPGQLACFRWHETAYAAGRLNAGFTAHFGFGEPFEDIYGFESRKAPVAIVGRLDSVPEEIGSCLYGHRAR